MGRSSPYCGNIWRRYCCLTSFFPIVDTCLSCEDIARRSCGMVPRWRFFVSCIFSKPRAAHFRPATAFFLNSHYGHTMCESMADIQSPTAEIRPARKKKKEETGWKYIWSALLHRATIKQEFWKNSFHADVGQCNHWLERKMTGKDLSTSCIKLWIFLAYYKLSQLPSVHWHCQLGITKDIRSVKNWVMRFWHGYLSEARCKWFA